jgi:hypothetical protein
MNLHNQNHLPISNNDASITKWTWKELATAVSLATSLTIANVSRAEQDTALDIATRPPIVFVQPFSFQDGINLDGINIPAHTDIHSVHYLTTLNGTTGDMSRALEIIKSNPAKQSSVITLVQQAIDPNIYAGKTIFISSSDEDIMREIFPDAKIEVSSEIDKSGMFIIARDTSLITKLTHQWEALAIGWAGGIILGWIGMGVLGRRRKGEKEEWTPSKDQKQKDANIDMSRMWGAVPPPAPVAETPKPAAQPSSWKKRWDSIWSKLKRTNKTENKPTETTAEDATDSSDKGGLARRSWNAVRDRIQLWKYNRELIKNAEGKELLGDKIRIKKIEFFDGENGQSSVSVTLNTSVDIVWDAKSSKILSSQPYTYSDEMRQLDEDNIKAMAAWSEWLLPVKILIQSIILNGKVLKFSFIPYDNTIVIEEDRESNQTATWEQSDLAPPQDTVAWNQDSEKPSLFSTFFTKIKTWWKAKKTESEDGETTDRVGVTLKERLMGFININSYEDRIQKMIDRDQVMLDENGHPRIWFIDKNRPYVVLKTQNGFALPFYRSSKGTSGKKKWAWYPFFGIAESGWVIKWRGTKSLMEDNYQLPEIASLSDLINTTLNYRHSVDTNNNRKTHPFDKFDIKTPKQKSYGIPSITSPKPTHALELNEANMPISAIYIQEYINMIQGLNQREDDTLPVMNALDNIDTADTYGVVTEPVTPDSDELILSTWNDNEGSNRESSDAIECLMTWDQIKIIEWEDLLTSNNIPMIVSIQVTKSEVKNADYEVCTIFQDKVELKGGRANFNKTRFRINKDGDWKDAERVIANINFPDSDKIQLQIKFHPINKTIRIEQGNKSRSSIG